MGVEPTISCLGSKRSATELHPQRGVYYTAAFENWSNELSLVISLCQPAKDSR